MHHIAYGLAGLLGIAVASPALAANENVITQSKALAGNVTPGDTPGFPITINTPGAYVFGSGIDVPSGQWGIVVNVSGVDIDMSGYTLSGNGRADYGIVSGYNEARVHDGTIAAFKASGMYIRGDAWRIEDMRILRNSGAGIDATGKSFIEVRNSHVTFNGGRGIVAGNKAMFKDSNVSENGNYGIECGNDCNVSGSTIGSNVSRGLFILSGIAVGNLFSGNGSWGIADDYDSDTGLSNNILIGNGAAAASQRLGGVDMHPNACVGPYC